MSNKVSVSREYISVKKLSAVFVPDVDRQPTDKSFALTINSEFMRLGYIMSEKLFNVVSCLNELEAESFFNRVVPVLNKLKGADVKYNPMYKNFPQEVMDKSHYELYLNAITHYWSFGTWMPDSPDVPREVSFESSTFKTIDVCDRKEFNSVFTKLIGSNASLSEDDKKIVKWFLSNVDFDDLVCPEIPFKENLCFVASYMINNKIDISVCIKTATDLLRVITHLSDGDISLAQNTKFKSLARPLRRTFCQILENVGSEDDFARHKNKWVKAFHSLHVGDYKSVAPKTYKIATKLRNNKKLETFNSKVEKAFSDNNLDVLTVLLESRPGDFARRLDHVLRLASKDKKSLSKVTSSFESVADKVSTRVLMQLYAHFDSRNDDNVVRVAYPKGSLAKAVLLASPEKISESAVNHVKIIIEDKLVERFSKLEKLGKVWIDPALYAAPVPMQQRTASTGLVSVARGTRIPINKDKDTLRFFVYWVGQDIDLSASFHDENFNMIQHVSWTNLKEGYSCHSGDITRAPNGAAEFIDVHIPKALADLGKKNVRYVIMNVFVYSGPTFKEHSKVYAGWMTKNNPNRGDIFDPKLVEQKIDLTSDTRNTIPMVFDLHTREAIWVDLATNTRGANFNTYGVSGNTVEVNKASINDTLKAIVQNKKPSLGKLFELHAFARGQIVTDKEEAEVIFSFDEGTTPFNIDEINSEYLQ